MTYVIDTHILIWFLDKNRRLNPRHYQILADKNNKFVLPVIVLAEIKHIASLKRINVDFEEVIDDEVVKSLKTRIFVIPVKTGIQFFQVVTLPLDTRLRGYDDFLRNHHC